MADFALVVDIGPRPKLDSYATVVDMCMVGILSVLDVSISPSVLASLCPITHLHLPNPSAVHDRPTRPGDEVEQMARLLWAEALPHVFSESPKWPSVEQMVLAREFVSARLNIVGEHVQLVATFPLSVGMQFHWKSCREQRSGAFPFGASPPDPQFPPGYQNLPRCWNSSTFI